jgi:hypothetical protein
VMGWVHVEETEEGAGWDDRGQKTAFLRHSILKIVSFPRQARDKHRESSFFGLKRRFLTVLAGTRYVTSMYYVLNALEHGATTMEKGYAMWAELVRDIILGMVAGLMTTITMATSGDDQEVQIKLRSLRGWMISKNVPKMFQIKVVDYCNEVWSNRSGINIDELLGDVPPAMKLNLSTFLYGSVITNVPLFRGLAEEVIGALCNVVRPIMVLKDQEVMSEGQTGREMYILMTGEVRTSATLLPDRCTDPA